MPFQPRKPNFDPSWKTFRAIRSFETGGKAFHLGDPIPEDIFADHERRRRQMFDNNKIWPVDEGAPVLQALVDYDERVKPIDLAALSWAAMQKLARKLGFKGRIPAKSVLEDFIRGNANVVSDS